MSAVDRLAHAFLDAHPARAAMTLEKMPTAHAAPVLRTVPPRTAAVVLREMTPPHAAGCLAHLVPAEAAAITGAMAIDDASGIMRAMAPDHRGQVLAALPPDTRDALARGLAYPEGTAGAVMDPAIFQLPEDVIVADARARLLRAARDLLYYIYVVDRAHRLVGVLDIPELMLAKAREPVGAAMHRDIARLSAWTPVALVRQHPAWHRYHAMPVVDEDGRLIGAIRYQTLRRLERDAGGRAPDSSLVTAQALGELFQLGTTGFVAGVAAAASATREPEQGARTRPMHHEVRDAE